MNETKDTIKHLPGEQLAAVKKQARERKWDGAWNQQTWWMAEALGEV